MRRAAAALIWALIWAWSLPAQVPPTLTLEQAQEIALRNHPRIASARYGAEAAEAVVTQVRSAFQPLATGSVTGAGADTGSAIAAGALQTSALSSRGASGLGVSQLVTDFGRTA